MKNWWDKNNDNIIHNKNAVLSKYVLLYWEYILFFASLQKSQEKNNYIL